MKTEDTSANHTYAETSHFLMYFQSYPIDNTVSMPRLGLGTKKYLFGIMFWLKISTCVTQNAAEYLINFLSKVSAGNSNEDTFCRNIDMVCTTRKNVNIPVVFTQIPNI